jgi:hypothetical protein
MRRAGNFAVANADRLTLRAADTIAVMGVDLNGRWFAAMGMASATVLAMRTLTQ